MLADKGRRLNRLKGYDYSKTGYYFVTICTKSKIEHFGKVEKDSMILSRYGKIAKECWKNIPTHYKNVKIDDFIIMPNHIHGIIIVEGDNVGTEQCSVPTNTKNYNLLSKAIKSFKNTVTKVIRSGYEDDRFGWQRSFYDHIIRDEISLLKIREYINVNPLKWNLDKNKIENLSI
ncbi:MAG: hypothetical protein MUO85_03355 [candidate division Zixibacteria bacterium]|nr:hypothetical protein [candidate division Zixibacteria bacterium]